MPYRADLDALKTRHAALEQELRDRKERARQLEALQQDQRSLEAELAETRALLDQIDKTDSSDGAKARRALPLLESVSIASPCTASWSQMVGDERVRFCGTCQKNVYNLSNMTREEGEALLDENGANMCVRLYRRADGTVMTTDCPVGSSSRFVRRAAAVLGGGAVAVALVSAAAANAPASHGDACDRGSPVDLPPPGVVAPPYYGMPNLRPTSTDDRAGGTYLMGAPRAIPEAPAHEEPPVRVRMGRPSMPVAPSTTKK